MNKCTDFHRVLLTQLIIKYNCNNCTCEIPICRFYFSHLLIYFLSFKLVIRFVVMKKKCKKNLHL